MQTFDVAHIREQGVDLIIVFLDHSVQYKTDAERSQIAGALQLCARSAGLAGTVVLVWQGGFFADRNFHPFFQSVNFEMLAASINTRLTCDF